MNKLLLSAFCTGAFLFLQPAATLGQEPVSTGVIQGMVAKAGTLTLRSDQTNRPVTFYGMDRANIFTADGKVAAMGDLQAGMKVTVQYAVRGDRWYISKVMLADSRPAGTAGTPSEPTAVTPVAPGAVVVEPKPLMTINPAGLRRQMQP